MDLGATPVLIELLIGGSHIELSSMLLILAIATKFRCM